MSHADPVSLLDPQLLVPIAREYGTPSYVYDLSAMTRRAIALLEAFGDTPNLVAYAIKANSAGPLLRRFASLGLGADVVTGPELMLARRAGIDAHKIVFSGVAKSDAELGLALDERILAVQVESLGELERLARLASDRGVAADVSLRLNPGLEDLDTHVHVQTGHDEAKFGIVLEQLDDALRVIEAHASLRLVGLASHVGSQFTSTREYLEAARILFELSSDLIGSAPLAFVDTGGGFGIDYGQGCAVQPADFVRETLALRASFPNLAGLGLHVEPGRSLVGADGVLLTRLIGTKEAPAVEGGEARRWAMIDAGMNDLLRPALYQAKHRIEAVAGTAPIEEDRGSGVDVGAQAAAEPVPQQQELRVVGPICESSDDFGAHVLPVPLPELLVIRDVGAYGYTMASRYNGRALAAEVFVEEGRVVAAKRREPDTLWLDERMAFSAPDSVR